MEDYLTLISRHYEKVWEENGIDKYWAEGPVHELPAGFCILEFPPHCGREMWTYATCGMSQPGDKMPVEIHIFSDDQAEELVELLTVVAHYHRTGASLWWAHTVNFGKPWLDDSKCTYGMLSLPYLDGEELEILKIDQTMIRFLWLIPITEKECEYKKKFGLDKFEELLESREVDFSNPLRAGVI
jgi:hypothetical protein